LRKANRKPLTPKLRAELKALAAMPESEIDTTEMSPITDWSHAVRGPFYRPIKRPLSLRVDADVVDWFQRQGHGYQTRMNLALREYVERRRKCARAHESPTPASSARSK
jgi:uncharacterized protein (DUF4415 family)